MEKSLEKVVKKEKGKTQKLEGEVRSCEGPYFSVF